MSIESHVSAMKQDGNWATELEILSLAHMLSVDIFTYSESRWIKFSGQNVCSSIQSKAGGLYLNHRDGNHYDVVLDVAESLEDEENNLKKETNSSKRKETCLKKTSEIKRENILQYKREMYRKKYKDNPEFRNTKLEKAFVRYKSDAEFRNSLKVNNRVRYQTDALYRDLKKLKGRDVYNEHANKESLLRQAKEKYQNDTAHRENIKRNGVKKYKTDSAHRSKCKEKSVQKYKTNEKHREAVKKRSIDKNALDATHKEKVKKAGLLKYHTNEVLCARSAQYENDENYRSKVKESVRKCITLIQMSKERKWKI